MPQVKDTDWQIGRFKTHQCAVFRRPISCAKTHETQNKRMEEDLSSKWKEEKKAGLQSQSLIKQTLNQQRSKEIRALHNGKGNNSTRRANYLKHICTQYRRAQIMKKVPRGLQRDLDSHTVIVGEFNTPLSMLDRSLRQLTSIFRT